MGQPRSYATKGILICLFGYFFVSLISTSEHGLHSQIAIPLVLFFQYLICWILLLPKFIQQPCQMVKTQHTWLHLARAIVGLSCYASLYYAISYIPIAQGLLLQYSAALWIPFISLLLLGSKIKLVLWPSIIIGFAGILLILNPSAGGSYLPISIGLLSGLLQGLTMVIMQKLTRTEPTERILFYYFSIGIIITLPAAIFYWHALHLHQLIFLAVIGLATFLAQKYITHSLNYASANVSAPICYFSILFASIIAYFAWHQVLSIKAIWGMVLVISGGVLAIYLNRLSKLED